MDYKQRLEWHRSLCGSSPESTALLLQLYVGTNFFQLSNAPSQNMPVHVLILEKFLNCMNQSFCTLFFLPKTWAAAFWRTALSSSTSVLQVDSLSSRNCSSSTFLSSSKRVSSFLGGLVPLFLFLMEKRHLEIGSL